MALSAVKCSQGYFFTPPRDLQEQWGKGLRSGVADGEGGTAKGEGAGVGDGTAAVLDDTAADGKAKAGTGSLGGEIRGEYLGYAQRRRGRYLQQRCRRSRPRRSCARQPTAAWHRYCLLLPAWHW